METKVKKTVNVNNIKQAAIKILAGLGALFILFIVADLYLKQTTNNEYLNLIKNGNEEARFQKAICLASGVYVSRPFDPGNGVQFVEIWDYNGTTEVHYFRPVGES